jgi:hypothetical protein
LRGGGLACCIGHEAGTLCRSNHFARLNSAAPRGISLLLLRPAREPISRMDFSFAMTLGALAAAAAKRGALR